MATVLTTPPPRAKPLAADRYERILSYAALALLAAVAVALFKGRADLVRVPPVVWPHLATIIVALTLTPVILLGQRGSTRHRVLGTIWVAAMMATAASSFAIRQIGHGAFSFIHLLSVWTLVQVPLLWWTARTHQVARHRACVRGMVTGALVIAGVFTFGFDRLLGHWLFA